MSCFRRRSQKQLSGRINDEKKREQKEVELLASNFPYFYGRDTAMHNDVTKGLMGGLCTTLFTERAILTFVPSEAGSMSELSRYRFVLASSFS